jgi:parallel beta-helix repeat protein
MEKNNKRKHMIRFSLVAMLVILVFTVFAAPVSAADLYVGLGQTYSTIQSAVNATNPGDTIIVHDTGTFPDYEENVDVGVNHLTIKEADGNNVTVKAANASDHVFNVTANYVTIKGLDIYGATGEYAGGICIGWRGISCHHCTIENCRCGWDDTHKNFHGIRLLFSDNNTLSGNTCNSNDQLGIYLGTANYNTLSGNTCNFNNWSGIRLTRSSYNELSGNTCNFNTWESGISLGPSWRPEDPGDTMHNIISGNICNNNGNNGIGLFSSYIGSSHNNTVSDNTCSFNSGPGIVVKDSDDNILSDNFCSNNECGIFLEGSNNNTISDNTCSSNLEWGIELCESNDNTIMGNTIHDNGDGILVEDSTGNQIIGNSIERNGGGGPLTGVHLTSGTTNTIISGNTFIDNKPYQAWDDGTGNTWEGNCWSDYTPPGPYSIDGGAGSTDSSPSVPVVSCDVSGAERNTFDLSEPVYCYAGNLPDNTAVHIYVVPNKAWAVGDPIGNDVSSDGVNTASTDDSGNIGVTLIWPATLNAGEYDIVIDVNQNGTLDAGEAIDGLSTVEGFEAVPEFSTIAIPVAAVLGLVFLMSRRSRHSRRRN